MKIGDLVLCGTNEDFGIIIDWDKDGDPIVWQFCVHSHGGTPGASPMYKDRIKLL
tara:strand:+ start:2529 stop:2693 length:165 start_codon:yes stop_codon:yes gene_type:complete